MAHSSERAGEVQVNILLDEESFNLVRKASQTKLQPLLPVINTPVFKLIPDSREDEDTEEDTPLEDKTLLRRSERVSDFGPRNYLNLAKSSRRPGSLQKEKEKTAISPSNSTATTNSRRDCSKLSKLKKRRVVSVSSTDAVEKEEIPHQN